MVVALSYLIVRVVKTLLVILASLTFNGSVAVITSVHKGVFSENFQLWTLNNDSCLFDGEVEVSWNIMFHIDVGVLIGYIEGYFEVGDFLCHVEDPSWFVYNSEKKVVTYIATNVI